MKMMNNSELIITIITIVFSVLGSILGYFLKKNEKTMKHYEAYLKVEAKIKELCVAAEAAYTDGAMKKKYVVSNINSFLIENNLNVDEEIIEQIIEGIITITKSINNTAGVK
jgi:hypothetical protein